MKIKTIEAEHIQDGTFEAGDEEAFVAGFKDGETVRVLHLKDFEAIGKALNKIAEFDGESIWGDDRDDAANLMMDIAREALKGKYTYGDED